MACNSFGGTKYTLPQIQQILRQAGWPENLIAKAAALVIYESNGWNRAYNGCGEDSYGWFQVYRRYWPEFEPNYTNGRIFDPLYNAQCGLIIYRRQGWQAWVNSNRKYNQNLNGIASQSQAIYNGSSGGNNIEPTVLTTSNLGTIASTQPQPQNSRDREFFIIAAVGLGALILLNRL